MFTFILALGFGVQAKTIEVSSVKASSFLSDGSDVYAAKNVLNRKVSKPWVEGIGGSGLGSWIELHLGKSTQVEEIKLWNGNWYSYNDWDFYNRASKLELVFSDGTRENIKLANKKKVERIKLKKPVQTQSVKIIVRGVHSGSAYSDRTAISEIQLLNSAPENYPRAKTITASSVVPEDNDGNYDAGNLGDLLEDTAWCENTNNGGVGQWVKFDLGKTKKLSTINLVNGNAADVKIFFAYNQVKKATLQFDDGSSHSLNFKPSFRNKAYSFPAVKTQTIKLVIDEIKKGKKINNTCMSEIRFE